MTLYQEQHRYPWEKDRNESAEAFEAFRSFRDAGYRRSLQEIARVLFPQEMHSPEHRVQDRALQRVVRWAQRHDWIHRVELWDHYQDHMATQATAEEIRKTRARHVQGGALAFTKIIKALMSKSEDEMAEISPERLITLLDQVMGMERRAHEMVDYTMLLPQSQSDPQSAQALAQGQQVITSSEVAEMLRGVVQVLDPQVGPVDPQTFLHQHLIPQNNTAKEPPAAPQAVILRPQVDAKKQALLQSRPLPPTPKKRGKR